MSFEEDQPPSPHIQKCPVCRTTLRSPSERCAWTACPDCGSVLDEMSPKAGTPEADAITEAIRARDEATAIDISKLPPLSEADWIDCVSPGHEAKMLEEALAKAPPMHCDRCNSAVLSNTTGECPQCRGKLRPIDPDKLEEMLRNKRRIYDN